MRHATAAALLIGVGIGCDAQLEGERYDRTMMKKRMAQYSIKNGPALGAACRMWGCW